MLEKRLVRRSSATPPCRFPALPLSRRPPRARDGHYSNTLLERKCLTGPLRYHRSMPIRCRDLRPFVPCFLFLAVAPALRAQGSNTTIAAGTSLTTENSRAVTGVRIEPQPDGTVWFLVPSNDRIVQLQADGVTMKQWQIRDDSSIGANPVDFKIDGNIIW